LRGKDRKLQEVRPEQITRMAMFPSPCGEKIENYPTLMETLRCLVFKVRLRESTDVWLV